MTTAADPVTDLAAAEAFSKAHKVGAHHHFSATMWFEGRPPRCWSGAPYSQCVNGGKHKLADGSTWCHIHSPATVEKRRAERAQRDAERQAKWAEGDRLRKEAARQAEAFPRLVAALRAIEAGDNDPRATAREALGDYLEPQP